MSMVRHMLDRSHLSAASSDGTAGPMCKLTELQYLFPHRTLGFALTVIARDRDLPREAIGAAVREVGLDRYTPLGRLTHVDLSRLVQEMQRAVQPALARV